MRVRVSTGTYRGTKRPAKTEIFVSLKRLSSVPTTYPHLYWVCLRGKDLSHPPPPAGDPGVQVWEAGRVPSSTRGRPHDPSQKSTLHEGLPQRSDKGKEPENTRPLD